MLLFISTTLIIFLIPIRDRSTKFLGPPSPLATDIICELLLRSTFVDVEHENIIILSLIASEKENLTRSRSINLLTQGIELHPRVQF